MKSGYVKVRLDIGGMVIEKNITEIGLLNKYNIHFTDQDVYESLPPAFKLACQSRQFNVRRVLEGGNVIGFAVFTKAIKDLVKIQSWSIIPPDATTHEVDNPVWTENTITEDIVAMAVNKDNIVLSFNGEEIVATVAVHGPNYQGRLKLGARKTASSSMKQAIEECKGVTKQYTFLLYKSPLQLNDDMLKHGFKLVSKQVNKVKEYYQVCRNSVLPTRDNTICI
jgi:hypothetical protein